MRLWSRFPMHLVQLLRAHRPPERRARRRTWRRYRSACWWSKVALGVVWVAFCLLAGLASLLGCQIRVSAQTRQSLQSDGAESLGGGVCATGGYLLTVWDPLTPAPTKAATPAPEVDAGATETHYRWRPAGWCDPPPGETTLVRCDAGAPLDGG